MFRNKSVWLKAGIWTLVILWPAVDCLNLHAKPCSFPMYNYKNESCYIFLFGKFLREMLQVPTGSLLLIDTKYAAQKACNLVGSYGASPLNIQGIDWYLPQLEEPDEHRFLVNVLQLQEYRYRMHTRAWIDLIWLDGVYQWARTETKATYFLKPPGPIMWHDSWYKIYSLRKQPGTTLPTQSQLCYEMHGDWVSRNMSYELDGWHPRHCYGAYTYNTRPDLAPNGVICEASIKDFGVTTAAPDAAVGPVTEPDNAAGRRGAARFDLSVFGIRSTIRFHSVLLIFLIVFNRRTINV